ncbi:conjugative transposon protein TraJ [Pontibacter pamirensis]|uniref:conjugative transposon protein TraJ n=1 Tax=Pontibacter pamirensis TaxID=2562824 RepID=UPI001F165A2B|nr:conjugative transposon protein TraJ [Pontibacter pamirensis]
MKELHKHMMQKLQILSFLFGLVTLLLPLHAQAQSATGMQGLHQVLEGLYEEMMPLCERLIGVGRGLAGFAALWYIASRVWRHLANAEPVDFYPLLRPFALGLAVLLFPSVLALLNGVLQPTVTATGAMVEDSDKAIAVLLKQKEQAIQGSDAWQLYAGVDGNGDRDKWYKYTHPDDPLGEGESVLESIGNDVKFAMAKASYSFRNSIKQWMSEILQVLFQTAALCINTIRTFYLIVLAVLGPLVFGFSVFDGFQHTLTVWLARYVNVFMWLPVANIFGGIIGKIQENMLRLDIGQVESSGETLFSATDSAYLIFLLIGIVGYFTVPNVANYIVHAGGGNALLYKVTNLLSTTNRTALAAGGTGAGYAATALGAGANHITHSITGFSGGTGHDSGNVQRDKSPEGYQHGRLSGKN